MKARKDQQVSHVAASNNNKAVTVSKSRLHDIADMNRNCAYV